MSSFLLKITFREVLALQRGEILLCFCTSSQKTNYFFTTKIDIVFNVELFNFFKVIVTLNIFVVILIVAILLLPGPSLYRRKSHTEILL